MGVRKCLFGLKLKLSRLGKPDFSAGRIVASQLSRILCDTVKLLTTYLYSNFVRQLSNIGLNKPPRFKHSCSSIGN
jgi:hypothetical protein